MLLGRGGERAQPDIGGAARGKRHDQRDRPRRKILRVADPSENSSSTALANARRTDDQIIRSPSVNSFAHNLDDCAGQSRQLVRLDGEGRRQIDDSRRTAG